MKIAILGFAGQGKSSLNYWNTPDNEITICDRDTQLELPDGVQSQLGEGYLKDLDRFDLLVRTPLLHPRDIVAVNSPEILEKVTSNTNEFMRVCPTKNVIAVTGTKGKGTTTTLIAQMLQAAGKQVHVGGNIGLPPLDMLEGKGSYEGVGMISPEDYVVLELANFQLIDLHYSPHIAVCVMVEPEHMDWHEDVEEYIAAKQQLFIHQEPTDIAIYYADSPNSVSVADASVGQQIAYMRRPGAWVKKGQIVINDAVVCNVDEVKLLGKHNWQNACAATTAVWQVVQDAEAIKKVLKSFSGLPYRLELVRTVNDVRYYNDSFGTTPETAMVAIEAFSEPKVIILGGSDKGAQYSELGKAVAANNVRAVVAIGIMGPKITEALQAQGFSNIINGDDSMEQIVATAQAQAQPGDIVLLSTACASFDMFKNYIDRGEQFTAAVQALA